MAKEKEKGVKEQPKSSKKKFVLTSFTIIILITVLLGIITPCTPAVSAVLNHRVLHGAVRMLYLYSATGTSQSGCK